MPLVMDFEFYAGGIEDGILGVLEPVLGPLGVKTFAHYSGELDGDNLKTALGAISPQFPLVMTSYTEGKNKQDPATPPVLGRSLHFRHDCSFAVICVTNDARGETARRRGKPIGNKTIGTYKMIAKVLDTLAGLRLKAVVEEEEILLTHGPLMPDTVEFIARMPNITAYAVMFDTWFRWQSPDRGTAGVAVTEIILDTDSTNDDQGPTENLPGVSFDT